MNEAERINKLVELGGREWSKSDALHRVYFGAGVIAKMAGYVWGNYNTGNVSSATENGERISNSEMTRVLSALEFGTFYYDIPSDKFMGTADCQSWIAVVKILREAIRNESRVTANSL